jgi:glycosyltransferase involved in cell wall biosynthesis
MASTKFVGAERSFVELCNELSKEDEVIALVVRGCEFKDRFDERVKVIELKSNPSRYNPFLYLELKRLLHRLEPHVIHVHSAKAAQIFYKLSKLMRLPPLIATKRNAKRNSVFEKLPFVVAVSQEVYENIKNPNKALIRNGIVQKEVAEVPKESKFTLIAIGALRKVKGFDRLINAVSKLDFDFQLWIVGEGEEREALESLIEKLSLNEKVKLLGYREDTHLLQKRAHALVISSHSEGFSRVMIEGLFYSDVVLSTRVPGSTEVLEEPFFLEEPFEKKLKDLYCNYEEYKRKFQSIKRKRENFTLKRVAKEYRELYQRLVYV